MNIQLYQVHIENFRSIKNANIYLNPFSVMFGANDSGKSNFLLAIAFAFSNKNIAEKDVFRSQDFAYSQENNVVIDLKFIPVDDNGVRTETFNDAWGLHLGDNVLSDENDKEYFAFRTKFIYDFDRDEYRRERLLIDSWTNDTIVDGKGIGGRTLSAFEFIYLDAHRDISSDIRDKASMWSKQLSKIKMPEDAKADIESSLETLSQKIMEESPFLQQASEDLSASTNTEDSQVDIHPITRTVDEIYKGLDIYITQNSSSAIPISNMGAGTRSRAVFASLKTVINEKKRNATDSPFFCITAFEEPEAHIHPQAQRKLIDDFSQIQGQRIITTHSPYILSSSSVEDLIYVTMQSAETRFSSLSELRLEEDELSKVKRMVVDTYGEILFAKLVVLAEGHTERLALPVFFKNYFNCSPYDVGVSITGIDGQGNYEPFLKVFESIGIEWVVFSDGEQNVVDALATSIKKLKGLSTTPSLDLYDNIIILDSPNSYERYLVNMGYADEIITVINEYEGKPHENAPSYFESFAKRDFLQPNAPKCEGCDNIIWVKTEKRFCCNEGKKQALIACMEKWKVKYALPVAQKICTTTDTERQYPPKIKILLEQIGQQMGG